GRSARRWGPRSAPWSRGAYVRGCRSATRAPLAADRRHPNREAKACARLKSPNIIQVHAYGTAHEAGIIHRDLKPGNIFVCRHQDEELVKVLDFGIAKSVGDAQLGEGTTTGAVVGSPQYMSPEQARALKLDTRTDLWSFGVILYRCLTGRLPFPDR